MLNPFPSLLTYSFFAPTLIRIVAGLAILYLAHLHRTHRAEIREYLHPIVGKLDHSLIWIVIAIEALTGLALFVGFETQIAAIIGAVLALRSLVVRPRALSPFDRTADWLLLAICCALLFTGAGAFAFDIPL